MASQSRLADAEDFNPFDIPPETRLMMRSIPYFQLRGYENLPDISRVKARVDSRNTNYRPPRPKSAECVVNNKVDYSHVKSKIDTGRRRVGSERPKSATVQVPMPLSDSSSSSVTPRKQLQHAMTCPHLGSSIQTGTALGKDKRKPLIKQLSVSRFRSQAKSRIDCSDPTPDVHKQLHSLKELEILPGREKFNPRFATRGGVRRHKSSLPANIGHTTPTSVDPHRTGKHSFSRSTTAPVITVPRQVQGKMETMKEATSPVEGDGVIVKLKQLPMTPSCSEDNTERFPPSMGASQSGCERDCQENRDSVSSSEDVGVNPEDCSVEIVRDAFAPETEHQREEKEGQKCSTEKLQDKIVGLEVCTDETQTTVNLLHLLRHKNKSVEQTRTEYYNHELWVIGEEEDEEEEEEEEESDGQSGGDPETIAISSQPVPQLFIVDENNAVVEKVKTGRRRPSRDSSDQQRTSHQLNTLTLSAHAS